MTSFNCYNYSFAKEITLPIFCLQDTNGKTIDLNQTFAPTSKLVWCIKFLLLIFAVSGVAVDITGDPFPDFWLAYLSHWGEVIGTVYLLLSLIVTVGWLPVIANLDEMKREDAYSPSVWTKILWGLFHGIISIEMIVVVIFWLLEYNGRPIIYEMLFGHGLLYFAIALDGHVLNRTPIRIKQIVFGYIIAIAYTIWTLIHGLATHIGNPEKVNEGLDDDAIYSFINWTEKPSRTLITVATLYFVVAPLLFAIAWGLSIAIPRRYLTKEREEEEGFVDVSTSLLS